MLELVAVKQEDAKKVTADEHKLNRIKVSFPRWIRVMIFHPFNPLYSMWKQSKEHEIRKKKFYSQSHPFVVDFVAYCSKNEFSINTEEYFQDQDDEIKQFIDTRLKCVLSGYIYEPRNELQEKYYKESIKLRKSVKRTHKKYLLELSGISYFLPKNVFNDSVFLYQSGLIGLSESVIQQNKRKSCVRYRGLLWRFEYSFFTV